MQWLKTYQRTYALAFLAPLLSLGCSDSTAEHDIKDVLNDQTAAWFWVVRLSVGFETVRPRFVTGLIRSDDEPASLIQWKRLEDD